MSTHNQLYAMSYIYEEGDNATYICKGFDDALKEARGFILDYINDSDDIQMDYDENINLKNEEG